MKLLRAVKQYQEFTRGSVVAIGNFDGVHLGHQYLLQILREKADSINLPLVVIIFEPQPREFFLKDKAPPRLSNLRDKVRLLQASGVDFVLCLHFKQDLADMSANEFAKRIIFTCLNAKYLLIGDDFRFGKNRVGDSGFLKKLGNYYDCQVETCSDYSINAKKVSSTQIREELRLSCFANANKLLGRPYSISGRVFYGAAKAREWGIPTANLRVSQNSLAVSGVYCVQVKLKGYNILHGVANVGRRPTVDGIKQVLEVHIFDFNQSLYGKILEVVFLHKIRDEVKFPSLADLVVRIKEDVCLAREYFKLRKES